MSTLPFKLSTQELIFPRKQPFTRSIQITKTIESKIMGVRIIHNLPKCFSVTPGYDVISVPNKIEIKYDPKISVDEFPSVLYIKFANTFRDGIQVAVKFKEEEVLSESLQCQICLCQYDGDDKDLVPRILIGCGHTVCERCARTLRSKGSSSSIFQRTEIACPFDRKPTKVSQEQLRSGLPTNFTVLEMLGEMKKLELEKKKNQTTEVFVDPDVPCYENPNHEATCYCETCKVELCQGCFLSTHSSRVLSSHQSIPISQRPVVLPKCDIHRKNDAHYLCKDPMCITPTKLFCDDCRFNEHQCHEYSNYMDAVAENQKKLEKAVQNLKSMEQTFQIEHQKIKKCALSYEKLNVEYTEKIAKINQYFDKQKAEALDKLESFRRSEKEKMNQEADEILHGIDMISGVKREMEKVLKQKNRMHDVQQLMDNGTALYCLEPGSGENFTPFSMDMFPDDMSTIASSVVMEEPKPSQRELIARACERRIKAKATRRFK